MSPKVSENVLDTISEVRPPGTDHNDDEDEDGDESLYSEPSRADIRVTIKRLKNGKAPGVDLITAELLKLGEETVMHWLTKFAASI